MIRRHSILAAALAAILTVTMAVPVFADPVTPPASGPFEVGADEAERGAAVPLVMEISSSYTITLPALIDLQMIKTEGADKNKATGSYIATCTGLILDSQDVFLTPSATCSIHDKANASDIIQMTSSQARGKWKNKIEDPDTSTDTALISTTGTFGDDNKITGSVTTDTAIVHAAEYEGSLSFQFGLNPASP